MFSTIRKLFQQSKPQSDFWKGAITGVITLGALVAFLGGYFFDTGIYPWLMGLTFAIVFLIAFTVIRLIIVLLRIGIDKLPFTLFVLLLATVVSFYLIRSHAFRWPENPYYLAMGLAFLAQVFIFGSLNLFLAGKASPAWVYVLLIAVGLAIDFFGLRWILGRGPEPLQNNFQPKDVPQLKAENPSQPGEYKVSTFTYGHGDDLRRSKYSNEVKYKTETVDATLLLPEWTGSKAKWREKFWGFGSKEFPLNGNVWMPIGDGPFPLILIVHGNHTMEEFSDPGYAYLGELLASRGFITVSVDENFINGTWSGDFRGRERAARGWLLLKHLEVWRNWNANPKHDLFEKVNMNKIILVGHSRGGEGVAIAAKFNQLPFFPDNANIKFDFHFNINGIVEIAPTDKRYFRRLSLDNINYFSLAGTYDSDEASFFGLRQYQRVNFMDTLYHFKAGLFIHRANHGQFNTAWGDKDSGLPYGWLLNIKPLITGEEQRQIAKVYIAAFAEILFNNKDAYLPLFKNSWVIKDWLPSTIYLNNFRDSQEKIFVDYEDDLDLTSFQGGKISSENLALLREEPLQFRDKDTQGNNAAVLGWDSRKDSVSVSKDYTITFDRSFSLSSYEIFLITMAAGDPKDLEIGKKKDSEKKEETGQKKKDEKVPELKFTIQLIDSAGNKLEIASDFYKKMAPRLEIEFGKLEAISSGWGSKWEPSMESFEYNLSEFQGRKENFGSVKSIKLIFDKAQYGVLILDNVGFGKNKYLTTGNDN